MHVMREVKKQRIQVNYKSSRYLLANFASDFRMNKIEYYGVLRSITIFSIFRLGEKKTVPAESEGCLLFLLWVSRLFSPLQYIYRVL